MSLIVTYTLLALWAALLFGGFVFGRPTPDHPRRMPLWTRLGSSFVLVVGAWLLWTQADERAALALAFAVGMTLGFLGDLFMAKVFGGDNHVLGGMLSFGLGHIAYIAGLVLHANERSLAYPRWEALLIWWLVALVGWFVVVYLSGTRSLLHYAALPYALLLASTAGFATSFALLDADFTLVAIGAGLFLLSDLILAGQLFERWRFPLLDDVVWLTYGPGQMLIVFGLALVGA